MSDMWLKSPSTITAPSGWTFRWLLTKLHSISRDGLMLAKRKNRPTFRKQFLLKRDSNWFTFCCQVTHRCVSGAVVAAVCVQTPTGGGRVPQWRVEKPWTSILDTSLWLEKTTRSMRELGLPMFSSQCFLPTHKEQTQRRRCSPASAIGWLDSHVVHSVSWSLDLTNHCPLPGVLHPAPYSQAPPLLLCVLTVYRHML